jgi:uncharacterized protein YijF (DUF1287 family)
LPRPRNAITWQPAKGAPIVHHIGGGQIMEDVLFSYTIIGHYRYRVH